MFAFSRFLLYFTEVARQGSFRKASETLHVAASSIDRQILRVEKELAMPLFERHPTGLRLTAAGELLLHAANNWKKDFSRVCEQLDDLRGLRRGHVRIATIDAINRHFFSSMLKKVHHEYPNISFTLTTMNNIDIQQALMSGDADFGIMLNPQSSKELQVRAFAEINLGIVVPKEHPLAGRSGVRFSQCIEYPFIIPSAPLMLSEPVEALVNINGGRVNEVAVSNNIHMIRSLIKEQIGIGILCWLDIMDEVISDELAFIPLTDPQLKSFTLSLCVAPSRQLSLAASMMLKQLEMLFSQIENRA
ncbi:LysR family transcriptional regulator [Rouxiella badensis]|jgi:DNA-binding transcriptional LysR family regulator|uniref:LysR family transcriptional regulator n=1 Tax=Rouxiella badensis TaxID=1646377 RepID=UPI0013EF0AE4|nr:LysR family transcriptional regulator [Rouxiella badensis]MCC3704083.1 LysR family transcriptional regulator [Rouxiella badensis]MCC3748657.1 LysR family transcriptional regulator [Rouxiella badensis]QII38067.1 LysR family transcriptional regulator [Rouxiella badensis]QOI56061.1 LysR family transcriptional regulator [Rouxiella badensis subsp. acadiensis]WAT09233.1 LysR family transcriptional regulator [Rouxiella badensis]